jgi:hypothetical protein
LRFSSGNVSGAAFSTLGVANARGKPRAAVDERQDLRVEPINLLA